MINIDKYFEVYKKVPLFYGLDDSQILSAMKCLSPKYKEYAKGEVVLMQGNTVTDVGIALRGRIQIIKEDFIGNRNILTEVTAGELFAEVFSCSNIKILPITAVAATESSVLFIDYKKIITTCSTACVFHTKLIENMLMILAEKNIMLNQKIEHISKRTTREKLLSFLLAQMQKTSKRQFNIPFNRQELADYLCVDRSAMSNELCKLRDEGVIEFNKNEFEILSDNHFT